MVQSQQQTTRAEDGARGSIRLQAMAKIEEWSKTRGIAGGHRESKRSFTAPTWKTVDLFHPDNFQPRRWDADTVHPVRPGSHLAPPHTAQRQFWGGWKKPNAPPPTAGTQPDRGWPQKNQKLQKNNQNCKITQKTPVGGAQISFRTHIL